MKVSQGGAQGARTNFFQLSWQKFDKLIKTNFFYNCGKIL